VSVGDVADAQWAASKAVAAGNQCRQQAQAHGVPAVRSASGALPRHAAVLYPKVSVSGDRPTASHQLAVHSTAKLLLC
jgi:hypothetical protein